MDHTKVHTCVETICSQGCNRVTEIIALLEQGEHISEITWLNKNEIASLLTELKAIMSVYQKRS